MLAVCNLIAGGVGLTLTAGTHVIFQDLDWVPANHRQAEDRAYRMGQAERVTVEYMLADGTLDGFIADLLEAKLRLIGAVEGDLPPDVSILDDLYARLRSLGPALLLENKLEQATGEVRARLEALAKDNSGSVSAAAQELLDAGVREFPSSRDPPKSTSSHLAAADTSNARARDLNGGETASTCGKCVARRANITQLEQLGQSSRFCVRRPEFDQVDGVPT